MKYKALLFDLDGTILDYSKSETAALNGAYSIVFGTGPSDSFLSVYHEINSGLWKDFEKGTTTIHELKIRRFSDLFDNFKINADPEAFSEIYLKELGEGGYLLDGALDVLESCAGRFRIGAITNGIGNVQRSRIKKAGIGQYFETVVISNDVGIAKPDPGIFTMALEGMNLLKKDDVLMIGDSLSSDILGGINAGIDTCWVNRHEEESGVIKPIFTISNIIELLEILN
jgi:YjjG family noncanonical pyrimidine nucleotidase